MIGVDTPLGGDTRTIYAALEVSNTSWILAVGDPLDASRTSLHKLQPHDVLALLGKIEQARSKALETGCSARVLLTYEAGYEGFWLARRLADEAMDVIVCDPSSLEVVRRKKAAKTDRIDAKKMVRALKAWDGGDRDAMSPVRVPSIEEEDAKRLLRRRERLVRDRTRLTNRIKGLLLVHGIKGEKPLKRGFRELVGTLMTAYGEPLPPGAREEILGIVDQLEVVVAQLTKIEARKEAELEASQEALAALQANAGRDEDGKVGSASGALAPARVKHAHSVAALSSLRGIGSNDALILVNELFYRDLRNRRELASLAGLVPVPWASGGVDHDQGISKAGNPLVRKHMIQMAWRWLRYQPESDLSKWYRTYVSARDGRSRKRAIVALARKLLIALWRYATTGLVPTGAVAEVW